VHPLALKRFREERMVWERIEGNWKYLTGRMLNRWARLSAADLERVAGRRGAMVTLIQQNYCISREAADSQVRDWTRTLEVNEDGADSGRSNSTNQTYTTDGMNW
jgi:uncharacterized protein YjbJ (UPF0337 family)